MLNFIEAKPFVEDLKYQQRKEEAHKKLESLILPDYDPEVSKLPYGQLIPVDPPLVDLLRSYDGLPHCFLIQSCYGHFSLNPLSVNPVSDLPEWITDVVYREAFMLYGIQNSEAGRELFRDLEKITEINPKYIQFGSSAAFTEPNSYVLQLEPENNESGEIITVSRDEALFIESLRNRMLEELWRVFKKHRELAS